MMLKASSWESRVRLPEPDLSPGGTKINFVYLSPATSYTLGRGATSGFLATTLKAAGYDGLIITGAAQQPVYFICG